MHLGKIFYKLSNCAIPVCGVCGSASHYRNGYLSKAPSTGKINLFYDVCSFTQRFYFRNRTNKEIKNRNFNSCKTIQSVSYHRARRFRRRADNPLASRHTDYRLFSFDSIFINAYLVNTTRPLYSALRRKRRF